MDSGEQQGGNLPKPKTAPELQAIIHAERRGEAFVYYRDEQDSQLIYFLGDGGQVAVGRSPANDIALTFDQSVSGVHALLNRVGSAWLVEDDGLSRNGTFLNGLRLRGQQRLRDGDWIRFGKTTIIYRSPTDEATGETRSASEEAPIPVTEAQKRVLVALCRPVLQGDSSVPAPTAQIAEELVVSSETVKSHLHELFSRFGLGDAEPREKRHMLVDKAIQSGTVSERDY